jgi:phenylacetic acid degradation operon negative regulatory protein
MNPTPKNLILNLLVAAGGAPLSASHAIASCQLFGIRENSVRVALVRLNAAGLIESVGRGAYRIGPQAAKLAADVASWRHAAQKLCDWGGGWLMVSTGGLRRSDRSALRLRERALALTGFKELVPDLYVRPDNLMGHAASARSRLHQLGLDADAHVFVALDLAPELELRARQLWASKCLDKSYASTRHKLETWLRHCDELDLETAARESYVLGHDAIRQLVFDPLLPHPLVDVDARHAFVQAVIGFDDAGHRIWQRLLASLGHENDAPMPAVTAVQGSGRSHTH